VAALVSQYFSFIVTTYGMCHFYEDHYLLDVTVLSCTLPLTRKFSEHIVLPPSYFPVPLT
jgi:hypothetical protein